VLLQLQLLQLLLLLPPLLPLLLLVAAGTLSGTAPLSDHMNSMQLSLSLSDIASKPGACTTENRVQDSTTWED
jgi:hypothetical protein